jgi:hypothetical protein
MSLVILSLLVSGAWGYAMGRPVRKVRWTVSPAAPQLAIAPARVAKDSSWTFEGWGQTREDAEDNALKRAQEGIFEYLAKRGQPLERVPSRDYIKKNLVKQLEPEPARDFGVGVGELQGVRLRIETTAKDWQYLLREDRRVRSESRMLVLAKLLTGLVAFLGAVGGYLRLEEMTKGYYTAWLRLAAIGFVTAVGMGIWWIS